jgi:hypothetical protein
MAGADPDLRDLLFTLDPKARDDLRRVLIRDQADRGAISSRLMRYRDQNGQEWADIIDFLTMYPDRPSPFISDSVSLSPAAGPALWDARDP